MFKLYVKHAIGKSGREYYAVTVRNESNGYEKFVSFSVDDIVSFYGVSFDDLNKIPIGEYLPI